MTFLPSSSELALFVTAAIVLLLIPGPAVLYILGRSIGQGRSAGLVSAAGIATGTFVHVCAASLGLSALLLSSATAYSAVKYAGAAYLFYLGIRKFRDKPASVKHAEAVAMHTIFTQGVIVNVLNPKTAIFFFAFLPQFVNPSRGHVTAQFFALGMLFALTGWISDSAWAMAAGSAAGWLRQNKKFVHNERYVTGVLYMGLGVATAVSGSRQK